MWSKWSIVPIRVSRYSEWLIILITKKLFMIVMPILNHASIFVSLLQYIQFSIWIPKNSLTLNEFGILSNYLSNFLICNHNNNVPPFGLHSKSAAASNEIFSSKKCTKTHDTGITYQRCSLKWSCWTTKKKSLKVIWINMNESGWK